MKSLKRQNLKKKSHRKYKGGDQDSNLSVYQINYILEISKKSFENYEEPLIELIMDNDEFYNLILANNEQDFKLMYDLYFNRDRLNTLSYIIFENDETKLDQFLSIVPIPLPTALILLFFWCFNSLFK